MLAEKVLGKPELAVDARFASNGQRVKNRAELVQIITDTLMQQNRDHWLEKFQGLGWVHHLVISGSYIDAFCYRVPHGPINNIAQTFDHPQAKARGITVEVEVCLCRCILALYSKLIPDRIAPTSWHGQDGSTSCTL